MRILIFCIIFALSNSAFAVVPSQDTAIGKVLQAAFGNYGSCYQNFLVGSDIPAEDRFCTQNKAIIISAGIVALAASAVLGPAAIPIAAGVVALTVSTIFAVASGAANEARICRITPESEDIQPNPYTDDNIKQLLIRGGQNPSVDNIIDKYNKICVEYKGQMTWLKQNECGWLNGIMFCAFSLDNPSNADNPLLPNIQGDNIDNSVDPEYLCVRTSSTCPCSFNLGFGSLASPDYIKDKDGNYMLNDDSTLTIKDPMGYAQRAARHCRALRQINKPRDLLKLPYTGIIDDVCDTWSGYSKNGITLSAGVVQCFESTMRNLFEKPMINKSSGSGLTDDQMVRFNQYYDDAAVVKNAIDVTNSINSGSQVANYQVAPDLSKLQYYIVGINDRSLFGSLTKNEYVSTVSTISDKYSSYAQNNQNITDLLAQNNDLERQIKILRNEINTIVEQNSELSDELDTLNKSLATLQTDYDNAKSASDSNKNKLNKCSQYINGLGDPYGNCGTTSGIPDYTCDIGPNEISILKCNQCMLGTDNALNPCTVNTCNGYCYWRDYTYIKLPEWQEASAAQPSLNDTLSTAQQKLEDAKNRIKQLQDTLDANKVTMEDKENKIIELRALIDKNNTDLKQYSQNAAALTQDFYENINKIKKDLNALLAEIINAQQQFMANALSSNSSVGYTPFQSFQGVMQGLVIIALLGYTMMIGYRMMTGAFTPNVNNVIPIFIDLALVYYFAMGNAWRDYFFDMILSASKGLGQFAMEVTSDYEAKMADGCNFMDNFYIPDEGESCDFPNLSLPTDKALEPSIVKYNLKTGNPISGCIRGPFIPRPNYEAVYTPVRYQGISKDLGITELQYLQIYCYSENDSSIRIPALLKFNQVTKLANNWVCPSGYIMEDGYRSSELLNLGLTNLTNMQPDKYGLISTSINIIDSSGNIINVIQGIVNDRERVDAGVKKYARVKVLEGGRAIINKKYRQYPIIEKYGVYRNMDYVGMFDTLDCKIMRYLGYDPYNSDDILSLKFLLSALWAGPIGITLWLMMLFVGFLFISMIGRVIQGYLVSIGAITILLYLSPLVMPCLLFSETKGYYNTWLNNIKKYATGIPISLLTIGMITILTDYLFYGSPSEYKYYNVFNDTGGVNSDCGLNDPANAPLICLFRILGNAITTGGCFIGTCAYIGDNFWKYVGVMFLKLLQTIIALNVIMDSLNKIESFMNSILGTSQDASLGGSIFNTNTGLYSHLKSRTLALMQAPAELGKSAYKAYKRYGK